MVDTNELHDDEFVPNEEAQDAQEEDLELEDEEELTALKFKKLRQKLKDSETEKRAALEERERARADFLNGKRRLEEQFKNDKDRLIERVIEDFLPIIDSFETALRHTEKEGGHLEKGLEAMYGQFLGVLKHYDITEIEAEGKHFNPHEHEAITSMQGEHGEPPDTILQVLQKGYKRGNTIIRPAKVVISAE